MVTPLERVFIATVGRQTPSSTCLLTETPNLEIISGQLDNTESGSGNGNGNGNGNGKRSSSLEIDRVYTSTDRSIVGASQASYSRCNSEL